MGLKSMVQWCKSHWLRYVDPNFDQATQKTREALLKAEAIEHLVDSYLSPELLRKLRPRD